MIVISVVVKIQAGRWIVPVCPLFAAPLYAYCKYQMRVEWSVQALLHSMACSGSERFYLY